MAIDSELIDNGVTNLETSCPTNCLQTKKLVTYAENVNHVNNKICIYCNNFPEFPIYTFLTKIFVQLILKKIEKV